MKQKSEQTVTLKAWERDTTLNPRQLRSAGFVPATLYGKGIEPTSIQVKAHEFCLDYQQGAREFQLTGYVDDLVKAKSVQFDPVTRNPLSIQFLKEGVAAKSGKKSG
ncbi:MAG TPA: hypothetical protein V6C99_12235 [Oculatellaceae cyanobacterium]|jgi:ribosomal protein L25 (general stress protein Ctc)